MSNFLERAIGGDRNYFFIVFLGVTGALLLASYWVITVVVGATRVEEEILPGAAVNDLSPIYVDFQVDVDEYVSAQSYLTMGEYQSEYEQPRNVRVLVGLNTQEVTGYMLNHFVAGLGVNCTYCHNINNYAAGPEWDGEDVPEPTEEGAVPHPDWEGHKTNARRHLELVQDLNQNWLAADTLNALTDEKQPSGAQMSCAACHYGQPNPQAWPADQAVLPDAFRLPLDAQYDLTAENAGILNVNGVNERDGEVISLDTVNYQQQVMYHMNSAMNVGCTHCHNSRYFPSREVPAIHYAQHMLLMSQHVWLNYADSLVNVGDPNSQPQQPSCTLCHQGAIIPPGAVVGIEVMPEALIATQPEVAAMQGE